MGQRSAMLILPAWRTFTGELHQLFLELTRCEVQDKSFWKFFAGDT